MNSSIGVVPLEAAARAVQDLAEKEFFFPEGLLGFPAHRHYALARFQPEDGNESPFFMLKAVNHDLAFPLIHPDSIPLDYHVPIIPEMLRALDAKSAHDLVPLLIVTVRDRLEDITVNLQGPLIIHPAAALGLQLVVEDYPVRHPLIAGTAR